MLNLSPKEKELLEEAKKASTNAYSPYSNYKVGCAVRTIDGHIITGCNVENASYSLTICAERNTIFKAISEGHKNFAEIAVFVDSEESFPPCGACRQVIYEFAPDINIIYANRKTVRLLNIKDLLPEAFTLNKA
ncbi:MAG: cytidine deaminase [Candidatus Cloacimonas sp.]